MLFRSDNYDSFTYNLYQYLSELGADVATIRNDKLSLDDVVRLAPEAIVLSPGPGRPENAGICVDLIRRFAPEVPILGICLGHQAIGYSFGGSIIRAKRIMHGKESTISHTGTSLLVSLPEKVEVMRYHSLVIDRKTLSAEFDILADSIEDHEIMAIRSEERRVGKECRCRW